MMGKVTKHQQHLIKHTAGIECNQDGVKHFKQHKEPYRNRFCAGDSHQDAPDLNKLVDLGLMDKTPPISMLGGDRYYFLTASGLNLAGQLIGVFEPEPDNSLPF